MYKELRDICRVSVCPTCQVAKTCKGCVPSEWSDEEIKDLEKRKISLGSLNSADVSTPISVKEHICSKCKKVIVKNTMYYSIKKNYSGGFKNYSGVFKTTKYCKGCTPIHNIKADALDAIKNFKPKKFNYIQMRRECNLDCCSCPYECNPTVTQALDISPYAIRWSDRDIRKLTKFNPLEYVVKMLKKL